MRQVWADLRSAALQGFREAPLMFVAPVVAIVRLFAATTRDLLAESERKQRGADRGRSC